MKKILLLSMLLISSFNLFAQDRKPVSAGEITIVTNEIMKFKNLRFVDNQVVFLNIDTKSEFTYFLNSIKSIENAAGENVYLKQGEVLQVIKLVAKTDWTNGNPPLRQEKKVYAQIIFKNGDTLKTYIKVKIPFYESDGLSEVSLNTKVTAIEGDNKIKYNAEDIQSLRIIDFYFRDRLFVSQHKQLEELMFDGKIKWYRSYYKGVKDDVIRSHDYLFHQEMKILANLGMLNNRRKKLKEITIAKPDLATFIDTMEIDDASILKLLKKFEE